MYDTLNACIHLQHEQSSRVRDDRLNWLEYLNERLGTTIELYFTIAKENINFLKGNTFKYKKINSSHDRKTAFDTIFQDCKISFVSTSLRTAVCNFLFLHDIVRPLSANSWTKGCEAMSCFTFLKFGELVLVDSAIGELFNNCWAARCWCELEFVLKEWKSWWSWCCTLDIGDE